jgi:hypothetical protein
LPRGDVNPKSEDTVTLASRLCLSSLLGVENLFDTTYEVGKTTDGIVTIGAPLLVHGGIQAQFQSKP